MLYLDNIYADISGNLGSSLTFTSDYGTLPPPTAVPDSDSLNLALTGKADGDIENITATYTDQYGETVTVGKLCVKSYEPVDKELIIVPINENTIQNSSAQKIQTYINSVYKQAADCFLETICKMLYLSVILITLLMKQIKTKL